MSQLHIYKVDETKEVTWVIAESEEETLQFMAELGECTVDYVRQNEGQPLTITQVPDDKPFGLIDDRGKKTNKPASEWCKIHGKGVLCGSWT